jgi:hypothetical protein
LGKRCNNHSAHCKLIFTLEGDLSTLGMQLIKPAMVSGNTGAPKILTAQKNFDNRIMAFGIK